MKKIISYSLYGSLPRYTINCLVNIDLCKKYYPEWSVRIYYDNTVPDNIINLLHTKNIELILSSGLNFNKTLWRFYAYDDADVVLFRDVDSYISSREFLSVNTWLKTDKSLNIIRDWSAATVIPAGMFGLKKNNKLKNMKKMCLDYIKHHPNVYGIDEHFLKHKIYNLFENDKVVFDSYDNHKDKTHDFLIPNKSNTFIGKQEISYSDIIDPTIKEIYKKYYIEIFNNDNII